uniref:Uncharacterized protein n=1 Tax=Anguilla anguilla TaxID=7936 RepID=A0A0E9V1H5_ANGAN
MVNILLQGEQFFFIIFKKRYFYVMSYIFVS